MAYIPGQQQLDFTGEQLRDTGMALAIESAETKHENWAELAFNFLEIYITKHSEFMVEDVREAAQGIVPDPPSNRAWGGIIIRAKKLGLIKNNGFRSVSNPKAHCTPATVWRVINE